MSERSELGRITKATFGFGGYQDAMIGLGLTFSGQSWGVGHFVGSWATRSEGARFSEAEHQAELLNAVATLRDTLEAAKRHHVGDLVGVPVSVTFEGNALKSWRVLTEVL